jgi:hypothetical protein
MSDNAEISIFCALDLPAWRSDSTGSTPGLRRQSVDFAAMQDRLNNFERRLARIERRLAVAQSELERTIRDSEQLRNLLEVPEEPLRMPFWNEKTQEYNSEPLGRTPRQNEGNA